MITEKIVAISDDVLKKLEDVLKKENQKKTKEEKIFIRVLPEEYELYHRVVELTDEFKSVSDFMRKSSREKIRKIIIPHNPVEQRFLGTWGIHRKIAQKIEKYVIDIEDHIEREVEKIDTEIDEDDLIDFIQKQQINSAVAIAMLRKRLCSS